MAVGATVRVDAWIWAVRITKTRSAAATACRGGHVKVNGVRVKPAHTLVPGDEVRIFHDGRERIVVVAQLHAKRVGAPVAAVAFLDRTPAPPPREALAVSGIRDRGAGRPTKRERRELEKFKAPGSRNTLQS